MRHLLPIVFTATTYVLGSPSLAVLRPAGVDAPLRGFHDSVNQSAASLRTGALQWTAGTAASIPSGFDIAATLKR